MSCTQLPFGARFVYSKCWIIFLYLAFLSNFLFLFFFSPLFLSSGADHAVCRRDERSHWTRWDNPVAVHSRWLKGIADHRYKKTTSTHTQTARRLSSALSEPFIVCWALFLAFIPRNKHTYLLLIVFCVLTWLWCLFLVLWYCFKGTLLFLH